MILGNLPISNNTSRLFPSDDAIAMEMSLICSRSVLYFKVASLTQGFSIGLCTDTVRHNQYLLQHSSDSPVQLWFRDSTIQKDDDSISSPRSSHVKVLLDKTLKPKFSLMHPLMCDR